MATLNDTELKLYLNGELVHTKALSNMKWNNPGSVYIGLQNGLAGPHYYWEGTIDDVRIYNRVLDPAEIGSLYSADDDGDGLPNDWESEHFGSETGADPEADPDGDGFDNLEEYRNETNPGAFDVGQCAIGTTSTLEGMAIELEWNTVTDRYYQVQWKSSLTNSAWENVGDSIPGNGDEKTRLDTRGYKEGFYRIVVP